MSLILQQTLRRASCRLNVVSLLIVELGVCQQVEHPHSPMDGGADLLAHGRKEFALRFTRFLGLYARLLKAAMRFLSV